MAASSIVIMRMSEAEAIGTPVNNPNAILSPNFGCSTYALPSISFNSVQNIDLGVNDNPVASEYCSEPPIRYEHRIFSGAE